MYSILNSSKIIVLKWRMSRIVVKWYCKKNSKIKLESSSEDEIDFEFE